MNEVSLYYDEINRGNVHNLLPWESTLSNEEKLTCHEFTLATQIAIQYIGPAFTEELHSSLNDGSNLLVKYNGEAISAITTKIHREGIILNPYALGYIHQLYEGFTRIPDNTLLYLYKLATPINVNGRSLGREVIGGRLCWDATWWQLNNDLESNDNQVPESLYQYTGQVKKSNGFPITTLTADKDRFFKAFQLVDANRIITGTNENIYPYLAAFYNILKPIAASKIKRSYFDTQNNWTSERDLTELLLNHQTRMQHLLFVPKEGK